jgi:hypothetical protein
MSANLLVNDLRVVVNSIAILKRFFRPTGHKAVKQKRLRAGTVQTLQKTASRPVTRLSN